MRGTVLGLEQCGENNILCCHLYYAGNYAGAGNLALMLDFRWVRGKNTAGTIAWKAPAGKFYTGKVNAGNHPRTYNAPLRLAPDFLTNIRLTLKIAWYKHSVYFVALSVMKKICFIILMQTAHIMKYLVFAAIADMK